MTQIAPIANPLLINALVAYEASFLDRESLFTSVKVCRLWDQIMTKTLTPYLEEEYCRRSEVSEMLLQAFKKRHLSYWALPVLDPKWFDKADGHYLIGVDALPYSLMRFQLPEGALGLIASVRYKESPTSTIVLGQCWASSVAVGENFKQSLSFVAVPEHYKKFQPRCCEKSQMFGMGYSPWSDRNAWWNRHLMPFLKSHYTTEDNRILNREYDRDFSSPIDDYHWPLIEIIDGTHPKLEIAGLIKQTHTPLPMHKPRSFAQRQRESCLCYRAYRAICACFSWLIAKFQALCTWIYGAMAVHSTSHCTSTYP